MSVDLPASQSAKPCPPELNWHTIPIPSDKPFSGWIAGPIFCCWCHRPKGDTSKPCWRRITAGALECPRCPITPARNIGYVPLITFKDHARRVVVISKTMAAQLENVPIWSPVVCLTPLKKGLPSVVRPSDEPVMRSSSWSALKKRPAEDIRPYLLRKLWGIPEVCAHFGLDVWDE